MNFRKASLARLALLALLTSASVAQQAQEPTGAPQSPEPGAAVVEQGKFRLHKFEQPIGEETYAITREGSSLVAKVSFKFTDRGTDVPLTAKFRAADDLTPEAFEIKGKISRFSEIDQAVEVRPGKLLVRTRDQTREITPPAKFFTIAGYSPATMQMLLIRYWASHGSPAELTTVPGGSVKVEPRGQDTVTIAGKSETLDRYTIEGLIWGRETLWFDSTRRLVAAVSIDAEFDHFEAIRDGYENALGTLVGIAGTDSMAALSQVSKGISGGRDEVLALMGGTVIDGTGRAAITPATVVIEKGRITAVGPSHAVKIPKNARQVDVSGKTILPGLWDMHAHFEQVEWGPIYLAAGVTTVRDVGNEFEFITAVRDSVAAGHGVGPRILAAGIVDGSGPMALGVGRADTPEQAIAWTDRYHDAGFQQMKIYSSVKLEEVKAIANEAHRLGMTVTGHVPIGLTGYDVIEAGQDQINHIEYVAAMMRAPLPKDSKRTDRIQATINIDLNSPESQKAMAFLKAHNTVVDPTMALTEFFTATTAKPPTSFEPGVAKVAPELAEQLLDVGPPSEISALAEKAFEKELAIVGLLHRSGIRVVAGTDQTVPGYSLHREIELYVQAGFTPMEAIQAATLVPAQVMGLERETGTVEKSKRADLIVIDGDPLKDIRNTRNAEYVVANGVLYNCAELWRSVGFKP